MIGTDEYPFIWPDINLSFSRAVEEELDRRARFPNTCGEPVELLEN
jgi:hypothetical protein